MSEFIGSIIICLFGVCVLGVIYFDISSSVQLTDNNIEFVKGFCEEKGFEDFEGGLLNGYCFNLTQTKEIDLIEKIDYHCFKSNERIGIMFSNSKLIECRFVKEVEKNG